MYMNGGHVYDADGKLVLNSPENVEALQFMSDLVNVEGIAIPTPGRRSCNRRVLRGLLEWRDRLVLDAAVVHDAVPGQHAEPCAAA